MGDLSTAIGALGNLGIQSYAIASGQPFSTTSVGGITTVSTGANTYLPIILGLAVVGIILFFLLK